MSAADDARIHVFTTRMPADEYEVLRSLAFYRNSSINDVVLKALRLYLAEHAADTELEGMVEEARRRFRSTVERMRRTGE